MRERKAANSSASRENGSFSVTQSSVAVSRAAKTASENGCCPWHRAALVWIALLKPLVETADVLTQSSAAKLLVETAVVRDTEQRYQNRWWEQLLSWHTAALVWVALLKPLEDKNFNLQWSWRMQISAFCCLMLQISCGKCNTFQYFCCLSVYSPGIRIVISRRIILGMRYVLEKLCGENHNKYFTFNIYFLNRAL